MGPTSVPRPYPFGGGSPTPPFADESWQPAPRTPFCLGPSVPQPGPLETVPLQWPFADPAAIIPVEGPVPPRSQAPAMQQMWLPIGQPIQVLPHHSAQQAMPEMTTWSPEPQFMPMPMELGTRPFGGPGQVPGHGPVVSAGGLWFPPQQPTAIPVFPDGRSYGIVQPGPISATIFIGNESHEGSTASGSGDTVNPRGSGLRQMGNTEGATGEFGQFIAVTARLNTAAGLSPDTRSDQPGSDDDFLRFVRERLSGMTGPRRAAVLREIRALVDDMES
ncbi:uncharacterized protein LOC144148517 [Haemaphysalis longicornis]